MKAKLLKCLVDQIVSIEFANDDDINIDFSVRIMEATAAELSTLTESETVELKRELMFLSEKYSNVEVKEFIQNMFDNLITY